MEEKKKYEKIDVEVAEQTLRDDLNVTGGSGTHNTNAGSENESRDYGKYVIIATLVVLAAVAIVFAII